MPFLDAPVTLFLLLITVMVSGYAMFMDPGLTERLSFRPDRILRHGEYYRMITAGFVHAGMGHLAFNMITLYFFGPYLEAVLGPVRFAVVYFGSELFAHGYTLLRHRDTPGYAAIGASGAISGILFAFCLFRPFERLYLFFALPVQAWIFAIGFVVLSVMAMKKSSDIRGGGIAHEAHLGGAIGGLLLTILVEPRAIGVFLRTIGF